jgi:class 3 adenylate cyclase
LIMNLDHGRLNLCYPIPPASVNPPLARLCPQCGASNEPDENFCGECAAALGHPAAALKKSNDAPIRVADIPAAENIEGERKTVTALFADIKGSTELMEDLDPEDARAIIDPALKLMIDAVQRYDGYVVQSTGDGIFAIFGAPVAHEDHPQRALYAALRMQEELKRYSDRIRQEGRLPVQARVGANTGEVVVRTIATGGAKTEYTPIGHTANLASRMQALAPIGSIAVTETTRGLCEGYFLLKSLGPTRVKGLGEPVNVYEVTGLGPLRTRLQRSAGRGLTKFVGREREMEALRAAADRATSGHGQIVAAMAEAGTGKSRLYFEFKVKNQSGWMVLETFSVSHGKASAYLPVLDLLHGYFKIAGEDDPRARRAKVTGNVLTLDRSLEDTLPYLFSLLGIVDGQDPLAEMEGQIKKRRTLEAIKRILLRESLNQPLMAIFEDLHWIDEATQELLNLIADSLGTAKVLLLVTYRPEYSHQWNSKTYYTQLRLDPLGRESADEMLTALVGDGVEVTALKQVIIEKTEGNPFFMEETVQVLLDEGALVRDGIAVKLTRSLNTLKIPPTVQGILAARIDRLPSDAKETLADAGGHRARICAVVDSGVGREIRGRSQPPAHSAATGRIHLRAAGGRRRRIRLQARADAGGRLQLGFDRAAPATARAHRCRT